VKVIGKKAAFSNSGTQDGWRYTVDDSIYGQFSNILFDKAKPKWIRVSPDGKLRRYVKGTIFGRTCDSLDRIARSEQMEELEVGDWLWFPRMGAYTRATATEFNGFPMPDVIVTDSVCPSTVETFPWQMPLRVEFPRAVGE
jgi:diaminopimelate decarboxylase